MPRILLIVATFFILWYGWQQLQRLPPADRGRVIRKWVIAAVIGLAFFLAATGRLHWVGAIIAASLPVIGRLLMIIIRLLPMAGAWMRARNKRFPSRIRTKGLELTIDLQNGQVNGQILLGPYTGQALAALAQQQLQEQLDWFRQNDRQSALLLNAFLAYKGRPGAQEQEESGSAHAGVETTSREEALQILGLQEGASRADIVYAHKRLIQKLHPDRGGNDYLAAKVNAAKDTLLG
jgi:hypothetical protein